MYYSGKQKCHTLKSQVLANAKTREIICTAHGKGRVHDFKIWKNSQVVISQAIECLADKGYQGIHKIHHNSRIPYKKKPRQQLSLEQKKFNRQLASERVVVENIHRCLKKFRILSNRYRNRRRRFGLRFNLIAGIYNYELFVDSNVAIA